MAGQELVFVYGTLRRGSGHAAARRLEREAEYVGAASWPGLLFDFGRHPGAIRGGSGAPAGSVRGDLYRVDCGVLAWLDDYEELANPPRIPWFVRERTAVITATSETCSCWMYRFDGPPAGARLVPDGDYIADQETRRARPAPAVD